MKIVSKKQMKEVIAYEKAIYYPKGGFWHVLSWKFEQDERYLIFKYLKYLRHEEFYLNNSGIFKKLLRVLYTRKKCKMGNKVNVKIVPNYTGKGVNIQHKNVIINGHVGDNCLFHGDNCLGSCVKYCEGGYGIPTLGNNVNVGYGAILVGRLVVADNVRIGAGAVVVKDIDEVGATAVGIPAKIIKKV